MVRFEKLDDGYFCLVLDVSVIDDVVRPIENQSPNFNYYYPEIHFSFAEDDPRYHEIFSSFNDDAQSISVGSVRVYSNDHHILSVGGSFNLNQEGEGFEFLVCDFNTSLWPFIAESSITDGGGVYEEHTEYLIYSILDTMLIERIDEGDGDAYVE